jgi:hypothetical protein
MPTIFEGAETLIDQRLGVLDVGKAPHQPGIAGFQ